ncbi:MAG: PorV/PorQ family protein [Elusimicrobia bacterium]|nr:PorV/PorQ family protein [Elusimicrobiota bacterium]
MRRPASAALALCLLPAAALASDLTQFSRSSIGAPFLRLGVGARAVAMGEAFTTLADDASAVYWNPAGMAEIRKRSATFMHAQYLGSLSFDYLSYAQKLPGDFGAAGASLHYLSAGEIMETDDAGVDLGKFRPYDLAFSLSYAYRLSERTEVAIDPDEERPVDEFRWLRGFTFGLTAKLVHSRITSSAQTGAVDLGLQSPLYLDERLRFGAAVQNIGGTLKFDQESEALPFAAKAGASFLFTDELTGAAEGVVPREAAPYLALGAEYRRRVRGQWQAAGRLGFNSRTVGEVAGVTGLSMGLGAVYKDYHLDYALVPLGSLGPTHQVSVTVNF